MFDVIIVGAGAAGLSAGRLLSHSEKSLCILEARDRIGGRIHTLQNEGFSYPVEAGAEFMHGELPLTKALMKEANVSYQAGHGRIWNVVNNNLSGGDFFDEGWDQLMDRLHRLDQDVTIDEFLQKYFGDAKYESLVESVKRFVQGYDAADVNKASAMALAEEWSSGDVKGYRPMGGYAQLLDFLRNEIQQRKGIFKLSSVVKKIRWKPDNIEIEIESGETLATRKILITVPISILKADLIQFEPPLPQHRHALLHLETGEVIKFLFEFNDRFWERGNSTEYRQMPGLNFLFSDAFVPTWWTQKPNDIPLLTGWLAGPVVRTIQQDDSSLFEKGIKSLAYLFGRQPDHLLKEIRSARVVNWSADEYSRGAYAYKTLQTAAAIKIFSDPVENTIFFAGEGLYDGAEMGTVEAALASGRATAEMILKAG
jgi:monoamine oxidase